MSARVFHYVSNANASVTTAACGVGINTKRDSNWSERIEGVSCKKCLAKLEREKENIDEDAPKPKKAPKVKKAKRDKRAIRALKKSRKQAEKYFSHVAKVGTGTREAIHGEQAIRATHAEELLGIIDAMLTREREGWLAQ